MHVVREVQSDVYIAQQIHWQLVRGETIEYGRQFIEEQLLDGLRAWAIQHDQDGSKRTNGDANTQQLERRGSLLFNDPATIIYL